MTGLTRGFAVVVVLLFPALVSANGWRRSATTSYYYAPVAYPSYTMTVAPMQAPVCIEQPLTQQPQQQKLYAQPLPAGPSGAPGRMPSGGPKTGEPPLIQPQTPTPQPGVTESRSYFNAYAVAPRANDKPAGNRVPVGFWNLTDRDITLTVDKQTHVVPKGKNLKLDLARQFVWRVDTREALNEQVPAAESGLEIVIRR